MANQRKQNKKRHKNTTADHDVNRSFTTIVGGCIIGVKGSCRRTRDDRVRREVKALTSKRHVLRTFVGLDAASTDVYCVFSGFDATNTDLYALRISVGFDTAGTDLYLLRVSAGFDTASTDLYCVYSAFNTTASTALILHILGE